jgi:hypothetical protein
MRRVIFLVAALLGACGGGDDCGEPRGAPALVARTFTMANGTLCEETDPTMCNDYSADGISDLRSIMFSLSGEALSSETVRAETGTSCEPTLFLARPGGDVVTATALFAGDGWDVEARVDRADTRTCCYQGRLE